MAYVHGSCRAHHYTLKMFPTSARVTVESQDCRRAMFFSDVIKCLSNMQVSSVICGFFQIINKI